MGRVVGMAVSANVLKIRLTCEFYNGESFVYVLFLSLKMKKLCSCVPVYKIILYLCTSNEYKGYI